MESSESPNSYRSIDHRVVRLWHLGNTVRVGFMMLGLLLALVFLGHAQLPLLLAWCGLLVVALVLAWWFADKLYKSWRYRIDNEVLETHFGVIFHTTQLVPMPRMQHVDIHRGPLERTVGLATLVLHTAGTSQATILIPGLDAEYAVALRDYLVQLGVGHD
jgi:hypothetical protein